MNYKLTIISVLAGIALLFILQNVAIVEIQFLFWAIRMPRSLLVVLLLAIGMAIGWFLHSFIRHRNKP